VQRFLSFPDVEIVACVDPKAEAAAAVAQMTAKARGTEPACFASPEEALAAHTPDAVAVFTPHTLHFPHALAALDAGAHVLIEKPMVCLASEADALIAKAQEKEKVLAVAYQMRGLPLFRRMRESVQDGALGELRAAAVLLTQDWIERVTASKRTWRFDPALSGGGELMDSGSHLMDVLLWAVGEEPEEVFAFTNNLQLDVDVLSVCALRFSGGALGSFTVSGDAPGWTSSVTLTGTEGTLLMRSDQLVLMRKGADPETLDVSLKPGADATPAVNFVRAVQGKDAPLCPARDALPVVRTTEALYRSAAEGRPVRVGQ